ncbi:MAG: tetratricopeptide repeat protein [Candidatus Eisenbacteria bacterium]
MSFLGRLFHRDGMSDYRRGILAFNRGDFDEAVEAFERTLASIQDPSDPYFSLGRFYAAEAHARLGLALERRGERRAAAEQFRLALGCGYRYPDVHQRLAAMLEAEGQLAEAESECRAALEIHPGYLDARCRLLLVLIGQGRRDLAAAELDTLIEAGFPLPAPLAPGAGVPEDPTFLEELRRMLDSRQRSQQQLERALESYDRGNRAEALRELRAAVAEQPRYADLRRRLGSLLLEQGDTSGAIEELGAAIAINPDYVEARLQMGIAQLRAGRPAEAIPHLETAARLQPEYPDARLFLALALVREGRIADADASLMLTIAEHKNFARARYALGLVRLVQGRTGEGLETLQEAIDADPLLLRGRTDLAHAQAHEGDPEIAESLFRKVLERAPEDSDARLGFGLALLSEGRRDEAHEQLLLACRALPRDPRAVAALARIEIERGENEPAIERIDRVLAGAPDGAAPDPALLHLRARALTGAGRPAEARADLEALLGIEPGNVEARVELGLLLFQEGRAAEGREAMAEALRRDATHPVARVFADPGLVASL